MRRLTLATVLFTTLAAAGATSVLERSVAELFQRADQVIYGVVESRRTEEPGGETPTGATIVTIRVERLHSADGADASDLVELRFGSAPDARDGVSVVDDLPLPDPGDRVLVARYLDQALISPVVGFWQGWWTVRAAGLVDLRGRVLGLEGDSVAIGAPDREVDRVVAAVFEILRGEDGRFDAGSSVEADRLVAPASPQTPDSGDGAAEAVEPVAPVDVVQLRLAAGPDAQLNTALERAAAAWTAAGVPVEIGFDPAATDRVRTGQRAELGPDVLAITRRVPDQDGVEVLLRPGAEGLRDDVTGHLVGRLLGLPAGPTGLRSGLLPTDGRLNPTAEDARLLLDLLSRTPEDLDGSGVVDLYDLALLAEAFGTVGTRHPADLDDSGRVDDADVERMRAAYRFLPASRDPPPGRGAAEGGAVSDR